MTLKKPHGKNKFCGPAVISILTGYSTDDAATVIRSVSGDRAVKGCYTGHLRLTLLKFGIGTFRINTFGESLGEWLKLRERSKDDLFLVVTDGHFQIVRSDQYICGMTKKLVSVNSKKVNKRSRITDVFRVVMTGEKITPSVLVEKKLANLEKRRNRSFAPKAKILAALYDCRIEIDDLGEGNKYYYVYASDEIEADTSYPFDADHIVHSWEEVFGRVTEISNFVDSLNKS
jgi:hypothetical protein